MYFCKKKIMNEKIEEKKYLFISYSNLDEDLCKRLHDILNRFLDDSGLHEIYEIFRMTDQNQAKENSSKEWRNKILSALENCFSCIVLYTVNSIKSQWVHFEIGYAQAKDKDVQVFACEGIDIDKIILREKNVNVSSTEITNDNRISNKCFQQFLEAIFKKAPNNSVIEKFIPKWMKEPEIQDMISDFLYLCNSKQIYVSFS